VIVEEINKTITLARARPALTPFVDGVSVANRWSAHPQLAVHDKIVRRCSPHRQPVGGAIYIVEASQSPRTEAKNHKVPGG
jgi:hypothetical protein